MLSAFLACVTDRFRGKRPAAKREEPTAVSPSEHMLDVILEECLQKKATEIRFVFGQTWDDHGYLFMRHLRDTFEVVLVIDGTPTVTMKPPARLRGEVTSHVMRRLSLAPSEFDDKPMAKEATPGILRVNGYLYIRNKYDMQLMEWPQPGPTRFTYTPKPEWVHDDGESPSCRSPVTFEVETSCRHDVPMLILRPV